MAYKKIFRPGRLIENMADLESNIILKNWFYFGREDSRPKHYGVIISMTYRTLSIAIEKKRLWVAYRYK